MTEILLVAGPSGCGKSTFIEQLMTGRISPEMRSSLPNIADWPQTSVKRLSTGQDKADGLAGLIVHYDTIRLHQQLGASAYEADDALVSLLLQSSPATILTIKIAPDRLIDQYRARNVRRGFLRFEFRNKLPLLSFYGKQNALTEWSKKWEMFCEALIRHREDVTLITIEPGTEPFAFKLVSRTLNRVDLA